MLAFCLIYYYHYLTAITVNYAGVSYYNVKECIMGTITIRNLPGDLIEKIKESAKRHNLSMEQEVREVLKNTYINKIEIIDLIINSWNDNFAPSPEEVEQWRNNRRF
jgi:hypothetical protein